MQIRDDVMTQKGRYKDMSPDKRVELLSKQAALLTMLEGKKTAADLTAEQQMQAFNTLEWIEAAINNADDERMVCRREKPLGSTRTTRVCRTAAQEREAQERAREEMEPQSLPEPPLTEVRRTPRARFCSGRGGPRASPFLLGGRRRPGL